MNLSIVLCSENPGKLVDFYKRVLNMDLAWKGQEDSYQGFMVGESFLVIGPHDKVHGENSNPERIMMTFAVDDFEAEYERVKKEGVKVIAEAYHPAEAKDMWLATFAGPDNNYFQLTTKMKM